jgi:hypothetical protein
MINGKQVYAFNAPQEGKDKPYKTYHRNGTAFSFTKSEFDVIVDVFEDLLHWKHEAEEEKNGLHHFKSSV